MTDTTAGEGDLRSCARDAAIALAAILDCPEDESRHPHAGHYLDRLNAALAAQPSAAARGEATKTQWLWAAKIVRQLGPSMSPGAMAATMERLAEKAPTPAPDVAALREARAHALAMTKKHGNPNGTDYEQGQNDMGFRWVSQLDTMIAALSKPNAPGAA